MHNPYARISCGLCRSFPLPHHVGEKIRACWRTLVYRFISRDAVVANRGCADERCWLAIGSRDGFGKKSSASRAALENESPASWCPALGDAFAREMDDNIHATEIRRRERATFRIPSNVAGPRIARSSSNAMYFVPLGGQSRQERGAYEPRRSRDCNANGTIARGCR